MTHGEYAAQLFCEGYNCAQAVAVAFCDVTGMDKAQMARLVSPFGGGFGRQREVCGAVSGMCAVYGLLYGYEPPNPDQQMAVYSDVQALCAQFREVAGSIVCRELLGLDKKAPTPSESEARTPEYYKKRPCAEMVALAAELLEKYIEKQKAEV